MQRGSKATLGIFGSNRDGTKDMTSSSIGTPSGLSRPFMHTL